MNYRNITSRLTAIIKHFSKSKSRVISKFLIDMIEGISRANSIKLTDIAVALHNGTVAVKHIHKRLCNNLGNHDLAPYKQRAQMEEAAKIDNDTLIFIDPSDIAKKHGKKFEAMGRVRDASESSDKEVKLVNGYHINTACGLKKSGELLPFELDLYAPKSEDFISENSVITQLIDLIYHGARGQGAFVLDRGFDRFAIIRHLYLLCASFIIRVTKNRHYFVEGIEESLKRHDVFKRKDVKTRKKSGDFNVYNKKTRKHEKRKFIVRAAKVELTTKLDGDGDLLLVQAKSKKSTLYFLTNRPINSDGDILAVVSDYFKRWKVEEYIRFIKQQYGLEDFRVLTLGRIKNLFACLYLAVVALTRIGEIGGKTREAVKRQAHRATKLKKNGFEYYRLADGLKNILTKTGRRLIRMWKKREENRCRHQLKLPSKAFEMCA